MIRVRVRVRVRQTTPLSKINNGIQTVVLVRAFRSQRRGMGKGKGGG